jgi:5-methylcytosine-specific restriction endonuclease McrA
MNITKLKKIVLKETGKKLKFNEPDLQNRQKFYIIDGNEKKTLFNYIVLDGDKIISGYLAYQAWWRNSANEKDKSYFENMITLKKRNGISIKDLTYQDISRFLKSSFKSTFKEKTAKTVKTNKIKIEEKETKHAIEEEALPTKYVQMIKELNDYTCENCNVSFRDMPDLRGTLLQVHHVVRNPHGPRHHIRNLMTLCTICHGKQEGPGHGHQRGNKAHHHIIKEVRKRQGIEV